MTLHFNSKDITEQRFGRLVALEYAGSEYWLCKCDCGSLKKVNGTKLRRGKTRSCGCLVREVNARVQRARQTKHGMSKSPEYAIWAAMHARCSNPNHKEWPNYGGRGVRVCERWASFENFFADMGPKPSKEHSLDRTDNGLIYSKDTCRWATHVEQHNNTRRNRMLTFQGRTQMAAEWARERGMRYSTLHGRIQRGWSAERVLA